jgi:hypothetical protein
VKAHAAYLAAMIDGEGSVSHRRHVAVYNTEPELIAACAECCNALGITYQIRTHAPARGAAKPVLELRVYGRDNFERIATLPLRHPDKISRLRAMLGTYKPRPPSADQLRRWYLDEELSVAMIARRIGRSDNFVHHRLRDHDIPVRSLSEAKACERRRRARTPA